MFARVVVQRSVEQINPCRIGADQIERELFAEYSACESFPGTSQRARLFRRGWKLLNWLVKCLSLAFLLGRKALSFSLLVPATF